MKLSGKIIGGVSVALAVISILYIFIPFIFTNKVEVGAKYYPSFSIVYSITTIFVLTTILIILGMVYVKKFEKKQKKV